MTRLLAESPARGTHDSTIRTFAHLSRLEARPPGTSSQAVFAGILPFVALFSELALIYFCLRADYLVHISAFPVNLSANQDHPMSMPSSQMIPKSNLPSKQGNLLRTPEHRVSLQSLTAKQNVSSGSTAHSCGEKGVNECLPSI
jgi:hypothetical protein